MARVPRTAAEAIEYFQLHLEPWENNTTAIGLTPAQLSAIATAVNDADAARAAALKARQESKVATAALNDAVEIMRTIGAGCLRAIVTKAEAAANPTTIYNLAQVEAPAPAEPVQPPEEPVDFVFTLELGGALGINFKSKSNGSRPFWIILRSIDGGPLVNIGTTTNRVYVDNTLPRGTATVTYAAQGYLGTSPGPASEAQTVQFGVTGGGGRSATFRGKQVPQAATEAVA